VIRPSLVVYAVGLSMLAFCTERALAEMGPCAPAIFDFICGSGDGAARAIVKTISPSRRLAFAWRLANKPPGDIPEQDDPALENLIVRLGDGTALAKSHGSYWDLSTKIAKAYLMTAWSPDSRLLVKIEQRAQSASAEIFSFAEDDATTGPLDLVKVIEPALQEKMQSVNSGSSSLVFSAHPATTIDDQGLLHTVVFVRQEDATEGPRYAAVVQITRSTNAIDAKIVSVTPFDGASISIIVH
jgi:hypothetical protein